jgi:protein gp37
MKNSKIEWCDHTFNPWWGCAKVPGHPGCAHCYAEAFAKRTGRVKWGKGEKRALMSEKYWKQPLQWDRDAAAAGTRARVFCASMADIFDAEVDDAWRLALFGIICATRNLDWLLLTKRPDNAARFYEQHIFTNSKGQTMPLPLRHGYIRDFLPNIRFGVSISDQKTADIYLPAMNSVNATGYFVSYEPAIGPVDFEMLIPWVKMDWIIVGGESGPGARPFNIAWAEQTISQCKGQGIACFVKQLGSKPVYALPHNEELPDQQFDDEGSSAWFTLEMIKDKKGGDMSEWPEDLRIRQFPSIGNLKSEI